MRIAVTGSTKLAGAIVKKFKADSLRVENANNLNEYDVFINSAHVDFKQVDLLYSCFKHWKNDSSKLIINISSRAGLSNISKGHLYAAQKAALDHLSSNLTYNSDKKCRITTIGLGLLEDELPSLQYTEVCDLLQHIIYLPEHLEIPLIYFQHSSNYQGVQKLKSTRYNHA